MTSIGAMIRRDVHPREVAAHARSLQAGFDELWVVEDLGWAGGISQMSAVLEATKDVIVGHGIAPAPFRNPAALAMEWATLAERFPGRTAVGIGHGVQSWMRRIGAGVESPLTLLGETISCVRALLAGETAEVDGRYVSLSGVGLEFPPPEVPQGWDAIAPDAEGVAEQIQLLIDAGADSIILVPVGDDVTGSLRHATTDILPRLAR